jgi:hypothetical protein
MAKNLVPTTRDLTLITEGPLSGWLHTRYSDGVYSPPVDPEDPEEPPIPGQWWTPFSGTSVLDPVPTGFTQIVKPTDARLIYLANGPEASDTNNGLSPSTPKKTAVAATALIRQGEGDILCVKRGENILWDFNNFLVRNNLRGGALGKRTYLTWYGTGHRPRIIPPVMDRTYHSHFGMVGIWWVNPYAEFGNPLFNGSATSRQLAFIGHSSNILIEDCRFTGVEFVATTGGQTAVMSGFFFRRNITDYIYFGNSATTNSTRPSAMYSQGIQNLVITENVHDYCGWHPNVTAGTYNGVTITGAAANQYNHGYYIGESSPHDGPLVEHNLISRPSSHGWQLRSGGIARRNITYYAAVGGAFGYYDTANPTKGTQPAGRVLRMQENLLLRGNGMYRMPNSCQNSVCTPARWGLQYTYKSTESTAVFESLNNVVAETSTLLTNHASPPNPNTISETYQLHGGYFGSPPSPNYITSTGNKFYQFSSSTQGNGLYVDPGRSLEGYFSSLAGEVMTYNQSMDVLKNRGPYEWSTPLSTPKIWEYIYAGYDNA